MLQRAAPRGAQFYLIFAVLWALSFMQQHEPCLPYDLHPCEGNPVKHRLIFEVVKKVLRSAEKLSELIPLSPIPLYPSAARAAII